MNKNANCTVCTFAQSHADQFGLFQLTNSLMIIILNPNGGTIRGTVLPYLPARISPPDTTNNHSKNLSTQICYKPLNITLSSQDYLHIFGFSAI